MPPCVAQAPIVMSLPEISRTCLIRSTSSGVVIEPSTIETSYGPGSSALVAPGKRAMAVKGNKVMGLAGFIRPGNRVDVLVTMPVGEKEEKVTKLVLEKMPVLATGTELEPAGDGEKPSSVDVYTLELTPDESEKLALASTQGTLHFALRNASDSEPVLTSGADTKTTLASLRPRPAARPGRGSVVEVITGSQKSQVSF